MNTDKLFKGYERAVSPVIGVILMVAITVILAAVIGTFVLGLGGQVSQTSPQASISMSDAQDSVSSSDNYSVVSISHDGGDEFDAGDVELVIRDSSSDTLMYRLSDQFNAASDEVNVTYNGVSQSFDGQTFATGDTLVVRDNIGYGSSSVQNFTSGQKYEFVIVDKETGQQIAAKLVKVE